MADASYTRIYTILVGTFLAVSLKEDDFGFLSEKQIWKYTEYFRMGF